MQHSVVRLTMDSPDIFKDAESGPKVLETMYGLAMPETEDMVQHEKLNTLETPKTRPRLSMHDTGNEEENSPIETKLPDLLETCPNNKSTLTSPTTCLQRVFQFQAEEQQLRLYPGQGLLFKQKKFTTPDLSLNLGKMKANSTGASVHLDKQALPLFVALLDMLAKTVKNPARLPPSPSVQVWIRQMHIFQHGFEKRLMVSPSRLRMHLRIALNSLAKNSYLSALSLSNPHSLTLFLTSDNPSRIMSLEFPSDPDLLTLSLIRFGHTQPFFQQMRIPPIKLQTHQWKPPIPFISQALDLQIHFPTGQFPESDFLCHSLDQSCTIVLGYHCSPRLQSPIDWVFGHLFWQTVASTNPRAHPLRDTSVVSAPLPKLLDPVLDIPKSVPL